MSFSGKALFILVSVNYYLFLKGLLGKYIFANMTEIISALYIQILKPGLKKLRKINGARISVTIPEN